MTNVSIPGQGAHNLLIVATVNDSVYAFDADDPSVGAPYWQVSFLRSNAAPTRNTDMVGACGPNPGDYQDFSGNFGIVGTPVIAPSAGTLYLVARTKENGTNFVQRLHALDLATGAERTNSPMLITATLSNSSGTITFDPQLQNQRPALALVNATIYIAWASHCDWGGYHGWLLGYDADTLERTVVYNDTAEGLGGGIWMSGQGPAADSQGNLYLSTGNGNVGTAGNPGDTTNRSDSFVKLTRAGNHMDVTSWFTPYDWQKLEMYDEDLGSAGVVLIPGTTLALGGGKEGIIYLVNRDNMGGLSDSTNADTNVLQSFQLSGLIFGSPVWWDGPDGSYLYVFPAVDHLRQYKFDRMTGQFLLPAYAQSPTGAPDNGLPGGTLSVSAKGTNAGSGIVWASHQLTGDANEEVRPGILHAYNAQNVSVELWNSEQLPLRDSVGNFAKFCPPTVANGKVYLATFSNRVNVYGLLPTITFQVSGAGLILTWPVGRLQQADAVTGPYNDVAGATSPYGPPLSGPGRFYRVKVR
jgi:hypothetical protein